MAGAIAEIARQTLAQDFRRIDPRTRAHRADRGRAAHSAGVAGRPFATMPSTALDAHGRRGDDRHARDRCDAHGVDLDRRPHRCRAPSIWAAGVVASPAATLARRRARSRRAGQRSNADLSLPGHPEIFVVGDTAAVPTAKASRCPASRRPPSRWAAMPASSSRRASPGAKPTPFRYRHLRRSRHHRPPGRGRESRPASS